MHVNIAAGEDMRLITRKELMDQDFKTQMAKGYGSIPANTEVEFDKIVDNLFGHFAVVNYNGNSYYVRPLDLKIVR